MQKRQNFIADQRWDLPQYKSMLDLIEDEFQTYNVHFLAPSNYIIKNWKIENNGGLQVRMGNAVDSLLLNSERSGKEGLNLRPSAATLLTLDLADNAVNYVEAQIFERGCAPDTVAVWDTTANSGQGQEFTQTVNTILGQDAVLLSNTVAFTGDGDKIALAKVTTSGGVITDIEDVRDFFFHLDSDFDFGTTRTDTNITNLKEMYDSITTSIKEMKGTPNWFDVPGPSFMNLLERINYLLVDGGTVSWEKSNADELIWTAPLQVIAPSRGYNYSIAATVVSGLLDGEVVYVTLPEVGVTPSGPLTVQKTSSDTYQLDTANTRGFILGYRSGTKIYFGNGWQSVELESGEETQLGDGITEAWIKATGLLHENDDSPNYTSTNFIAVGDSFVSAISDLDAIAYVLLGLIQGAVYQESYIVPSGGHPSNTQITLPLGKTYQLTYNQVEVYFDGKLKFPGATEDYLEINDGGGIGTKIEILFSIPEDTKITFRVQMGGSASGASSPMDIYNQGILIESSVAKMRFVGAGVTASQLAPGDVQISVTGSAASALTKRYLNSSGIAIPLNKVVAFLNDGSIVLADANIPGISDLSGITTENIPHGSYGSVIKSGNVSGILTGLGADNGDRVFMGETPGEISLTPPLALTDTIIALGRAEPADGVSGASVDLYLHPEVVAEP